MSLDHTLAPEGRDRNQGLDTILGGGLSAGHVFLLEGNPGTGKTTIALRFLIEGAAQGERGLYITLSETEPELRLSAASHGWTIGEGIEIFELSRRKACSMPTSSRACSIPPISNSARRPSSSSQAFERVRPTRVVLDSLSEIRLLAQSSLRYRRQILALKHYFARPERDRADARRYDRGDTRQDRPQRGAWRDPSGGDGARVTAPSAGGSGSSNIARRAIAAAITISPSGSGGASRSFRAWSRPSIALGSSGGHDQRYPGIRRAARRRRTKQGSSALILGPSGTGKSLVALQFVVAAIARGEKAAMFIFDEEMGLLFDRAQAAGLRPRSACATAGSLHDRAARCGRAVARASSRTACGTGSTRRQRARRW